MTGWFGRMGTSEGTRKADNEMRTDTESRGMSLRQYIDEVVVVVACLVCRNRMPLHDHAEKDGEKFSGCIQRPCLHCSVFEMSRPSSSGSSPSEDSSSESSSSRSSSSRSFFAEVFFVEIFFLAISVKVISGDVKRAQVNE